MALKSDWGQLSPMLAGRISANIQRLREAKGWSRPQLGLRLSPPTSGQQIERLEKGDRRLTVEWIERIAAGLGVDAADLIAGQAQEFELTPQVADVAAATLARIALRGGEPDSAVVADLSLLLTGLCEMFARHPATRSDPQAASPVVDFLARRHAQP